MGLDGIVYKKGIKSSATRSLGFGAVANGASFAYLLSSWSVLVMVVELVGSESLG